MSYNRQGHTSNHIHLLHRHIMIVIILHRHIIIIKIIIVNSFVCDFSKLECIAHYKELKHSPNKLPQVHACTHTHTPSQ